MKTCHIPPGRPSQLDKHIIYDGRFNKFSFVQNNCKFTCVYLTPRKVCENQKKIECKERKRKENGKETKEKDKRLGMKLGK